VKETRGPRPRKERKQGKMDDEEDEKKREGQEFGSQGEPASRNGSGPRARRNIELSKRRTGVQQGAL